MVFGKDRQDPPLGIKLTNKIAMWSPEPKFFFLGPDNVFTGFYHLYLSVLNERKL